MSHLKRKMADLLSTRRIGVFGHVGIGNLGDEAIFAAVIQNIKSRYPSAEICCFTINPADTRERHKAVAFPIRRIDETPGRVAPHEKDQVIFQENNRTSTLLQMVKSGLKAIPFVYLFLRKIPEVFRILRAILKEPGFLLQCRRNLKGVDLLIVAGSQQLIDYAGGGPWGHPYTLLKWSLIARTQKTRLAFVSSGAGPIQTSLGGFFIRSALSLADYTSYRDEVSRKCVEQLGVAGHKPVVPDLAYSLCVNQTSPEESRPTVARPVVGINPLPFLQSHFWGVGGSAQTYEIYVRKLADLALWLIQRGNAVLFFPTQLRGDPPVIEEIRSLMNKSGVPDVEKNIINYPVHSFDDLRSALSMTDLIIATRFHGVVLSYIFNKPVLGIAYAKKTSDLMEQMGQGEFAMDILSFELKSLQGKFLVLESQKTAIKTKLARQLSAHRQALDVQYDQLFRLLQRDRQ
jgi:polysaccharide pyruvyl transferase WcaK-like protein